MTHTTDNDREQSESQEESPRNRRRDAIRYTTAGGVGVTAVAVAFLLNGQQDLQADMRRLADAQQQQAAAIERIQTTATSWYGSNAAEHAAMGARITAREQGSEAHARDIEALRRADADIGSRLTHLEQRADDRTATRNPDHAGRLAQLMAAIRQIPPDDPDAWTSDTPRRPTTAALTRVIGTPVTADERDLAFGLANLQ